MSKINEQIINCGRCGEDFSMLIYDSINVSRDPGLKQQLLNEELNRTSCPNCGMKYLLDKPILYHDMEKRLMVYVLPETFLEDKQKYQNQYEEILKEQSVVLNRLTGNEKKYFCSIVFGVDELKQELKNTSKQDVCNKKGEMTYKKCTSCGQQVESDSKFCEFCGKEISEVSDEIFDKIFGIKKETKLMKFRRFIKKYIDRMLIIVGFGMFAYGMMWYVSVGSRLIRRSYSYSDGGEYNSFFVFIAISIMMIITGLLMMRKNK
jgi:RNA polymerase subunit RPABC4/transcription elongation factor Spt4